MEDLKFLVAGCGHILSANNLGGTCSRCGKLCCKRCLTVIVDQPLCPTCLKDKLRDEDGSLDL